MEKTTVETDRTKLTVQKLLAIRRSFVVETVHASMTGYSVTIIMTAQINPMRKNVLPLPVGARRHSSSAMMVPVLMRRSAVTGSITVPMALTNLTAMSRNH
jgi:hypothetical protein